MPVDPLYPRLIVLTAGTFHCRFFRDGGDSLAIARQLEILSGWFFFLSCVLALTCFFGKQPAFALNAGTPFNTLPPGNACEVFAWDVFCVLGLWVCFAPLIHLHAVSTVFKSAEKIPLLKKSENCVVVCFRPWLPAVLLADAKITWLFLKLQRISIRKSPFFSAAD